MLKKSASRRRPLFGLSGFLLNETNQMNQINQINKTNQINQRNQTCAGLKSPSRMSDPFNYDRTNSHSA
jgi:hypothetical protein